MYVDVIPAKAGIYYLYKIRHTHDAIRECILSFLRYLSFIGLYQPMA